MMLETNLMVVFTISLSVRVPLVLRETYNRTYFSTDLSSSTP